MTADKTVFVIFHGRFPSERAAAIYVKQHAESFFPHFGSVCIVVPRRLGAAGASQGLHLPTNVRMVYLPTVDIFWVPLLNRAAFWVSMAVFSASVCLYLALRAKKNDFVMTNELLPALGASFFTRSVFEVHNYPEGWIWFYILLFRRCEFLLVTNEWKARELCKQFSLPREKLIIERNGVDLTMFSERNKRECRQTLGLPQDARIVVYTGHLYGWKGVDTLAQGTARLSETLVYFVGGTPEDVAQFKERYGATKNIRIVGHVPHHAIPLWQGAADALVLPNTAQEEISNRYTSPMKLFEYMASGRPIVASNIPSVAEVLPETAAFLVEPDNPEALAQGVQAALSGGEERAAAARELVKEYSWEKRAARIVKHLSA